MTVNPPEADNFINVEQPGGLAQVTHDDDAIYLGDVQNVQAELHAANVEGRAPNLDDYHDAVLKAAGVDPEKYAAKPENTYETDENGEFVNDSDGNPKLNTPDLSLDTPQYLDNGPAQTPITNGNEGDQTQVNERKEPDVYAPSDDELENHINIQNDIKEQQEAGVSLDLTPEQDPESVPANVTDVPASRIDSSGISNPSGGLKDDAAIVNADGEKTGELGDREPSEPTDDGVTTRNNPEDPQQNGEITQADFEDEHSNVNLDDPESNGKTFEDEQTSESEHTSTITSSAGDVEVLDDPEANNPFK